MKLYKLANMNSGWFAGDFDPVALKTPTAEVAYREFRKGDTSAAHVHKIAQEVTVIAEGRVRMNDREYTSGDIIVLEPGEATDFEALTDGASVVVKVPSVPGDKYPV